jgi:hypothetical protein
MLPGVATEERKTGLMYQKYVTRVKAHNKTETEMVKTALRPALSHIFVGLGGG